jgi:HK97 family phage major capsid protein
MATRRSLLDPIINRPGLIRDLIDGDEELSAARAYKAAMSREFASRGGPPDIGSILQGMIGSARADNDSARAVIDGILRRAQFGPLARDTFTTPGFLDLPALLGRSGTESLSGGSTYGFLVKPEYATTVADRARKTVGPWSFCNIWEVPNSREYKVPVTAETNTAIANQLGGLAPNNFGHGELVLGTLKADGAVAERTFTQDRLLAYSIVSEDVWADSTSLARWFYYAFVAGFRNAIELAMIQGLSNGLGPAGIVNSNATVKVSRTTGGTIKEADLDNLYQAVASQCQENAVWFVSKPAFQTIRKLVYTTGTASALTFPFSWIAGEPHEYPMIYGCPVIQSEFCSAVGTPGDICLADFSQYILTWIRPRSSFRDNTVVPSGALELAFADPADPMHRGVVAMPLDSVEVRASNQLLFDTSKLAVAAKFRGGGGWIWGQTATENGVTVGPAAYLST